MGKKRNLQDAIAQAQLSCTLAKAPFNLRLTMRKRHKPHIHPNMF